MLYKMKKAGFEKDIQGADNMKKILFVAVSMLIALCAGHAMAAKAGLERHTLEYGGMTRTYWVHDPRALHKTAGKGPRPLVVVLHGGGGKAEKFDVMTGRDASFDTLADKEDLLIVYPQGFDKQWNDGRGVENIKPQEMGLDDVGFLSALIDEMLKTGNVNPKRVYATGPSNGGFMSNRLACDLADKIAAVGIVIAAMPVKLKDKCKPAAPVSVLIMDGTADPLVPYKGGVVQVFKHTKPRGAVHSAPETFDFWLAQAGNDKGGKSVPMQMLADADPKDKTRITLQDYKGKDAEVAFYSVIGGGHTWPGGRQYLFEFLVGRTSHDLDATRAIWDFFKRNPKR